MADSIHANYGRIGFAVVAGTLAIVGTLVYLGGFGGRSDIVYAETYSDNAVAGLSVGSDVNMRGVKIGEVKDISFIGSEYEEAAESDIPKIYILMALTTKKMRLTDDDDPEEILRMMVRKGIHATVASSGITGLSKIELNFPKTDVEDQKISWEPRYVCIPPAQSMLENFSDTLAKFMGQINDVDIVSVWSNVSSVASSAASITENVDELVDGVKEGVASVVRNIDETAMELRALSAELKDNPSLLLRPRDPDPLPETSR